MAVQEAVDGHRTKVAGKGSHWCVCTSQVVVRFTEASMVMGVRQLMEEALVM